MQVYDNDCHTQLCSLSERILYLYNIPCWVTTCIVDLFVFCFPCMPCPPAIHYPSLWMTPSKQEKSPSTGTRIMPTAGYRFRLPVLPGRPVLSSVLSTIQAPATVNGISATQTRKEKGKCPLPGRCPCRPCINIRYTRFRPRLSMKASTYELGKNLHAIKRVEGIPTTCPKGTWSNVVISTSATTGQRLPTLFVLLTFLESPKPRPRPVVLVVYVD